MLFMHPDLPALFLFIYEQWGVAAAWGEVSRCCDFRMDLFFIPCLCCDRLNHLYLYMYSVCQRYGILLVVESSS